MGASKHGSKEIFAGRGGGHKGTSGGSSKRALGAYGANAANKAAKAHEKTMTTDCLEIASRTRCADSAKTRP